MKKFSKAKLIVGISLIAAFVVWTFLVSFVGVEKIGPDDSSVGFANLNGWFHSLISVHLSLYNITDALSVIPIGISLAFAVIGLVQLIKRKSFIKVDFDILMLGAHYIAVFLSYIFFEIIIVNYRPIVFDGVLEASYPSSTTMLTLSIMIPLAMQIKLRIQGKWRKMIIIIAISLFTSFMVLARIISGVHWITDVIGGALLSAGLIIIYSAVFKIFHKN